MTSTQFESSSDPVQPSRFPAALLLVYLVVFGITAIKPHNRSDWVMENIIVFLALPLLVVGYRWFRLSNLSYLLLAIFLTLHSIGAHYTYSEVPVGNWLRDSLHLSRNHYDRVVHFSFGLLLTYPLREALVRLAAVKGFWSYVLPAHVVMAWSGLYEVFEGIVAALTSPELGAAYNGIQGDIWDAQKDMAMAAAGAVISMIATLASTSMRRHPSLGFGRDVANVGPVPASSVGDNLAKGR